MKNKKNTTLSEQLRNQISKSLKNAKLIYPSTHIYKTAQLPGLVQALLIKVAGLN